MMVGGVFVMFSGFFVMLHAFTLSHFVSLLSKITRTRITQLFLSVESYYRTIKEKVRRLTDAEGEMAEM
jgi:hypothetical protein